MPSEHQQPRTPISSPPPQSIPLQDLSRPPDVPTVRGGARRGERRPGERGARAYGQMDAEAAAGSGGNGDGVGGGAADTWWGLGAPRGNGRTGSLSGNRQAFTGRIKPPGSRYDRVLATPSEDTGGDGNRLDVPHVTTPRNAHRPSGYYEEPELSPLNVHDFQAAMGSVELGLDESDPQHTPSGVAPGAEDSGRQRNIPLTVNTGTPAVSPFSQNDNDDYFAANADDRSPLTDTRFLQPISGSPLPPATPSQRQIHDIRRYPSRSHGMLGDDLPGADGALSPGYRRSLNRRSLNRMSSLSVPSISRSLSTSASPLSTAGSMLRKMSQRVVNLSNEPDSVAQHQQEQQQQQQQQQQFVHHHNHHHHHTSERRQATLEAPPSFPAMTEYAHDEPSSSSSPVEKPQFTTGKSGRAYQQQPNPLQGHTLGFFSPDNHIRLWLCEVLVHPVTEPVILILIILQTVILAADAGPSLPYGARTAAWGHRWVDTALLILFVIYTIEIGARIVVSGFIRNAPKYSSLPPGTSVRRAILDKARELFAPGRASAAKKSTSAAAAAAQPDAQPSILRTFTSMQAESDQRGYSRHAQRVRLARRAYLRHSFNRLDFLAVVAFWVSFFLAIFNLEDGKHIYTFQMLSCLRILHLLSLTKGTSIILRSLKKAAPLLVRVAFLIGFFWLLFAIVGIQSFKSSFRRTCVFYGGNVSAVTNGTATPDVIANNYTQNLAPENIQFCGGHINAVTFLPEPYLLSDLRTPGASASKGFLCPPQSLCVEGSNPYNGTVSFDNILQSLELVFVIMSANTFSDLLYYTTNSDILAGALYFAFGMVIMTFWLINLLVAVITSSFQVIREESKTSAFTTDDHILTVEEEEEQPRKKTRIKRIFDKTYWFWIAIIIVSLIVQCLRTSSSSPNELAAIDTTETVMTFILLVEMILRFATDWKNFHKSPRNWVDLFLAVVTSIILLPPIRNSGQPYAWLTFFQIIRIYRVVLAVSLTRDLIMTILGSVSGILNLIVFVFLVTFLAAIFAVQLYRGEIPAQDASGANIRITFTNIYNAFIGMYQILSTENWTAILYTTTQYDSYWNTAWIDATFFILWYIFANFVILNMFIAVIQENFDVSEDEKRLHQVKAFLQQKELAGSAHGNLSLSAIFRLGRDKDRHRDPIDYGPATIEMFKDTVVRDFLDEQMEALEGEPIAETDGAGTMLAHRSRDNYFISTFHKLSSLIWDREQNPFYSQLTFSRPYEDLDPRSMAKEIATAAEQRKKAQRTYLQKHPHYNVSLFLFRPGHPLRKLCQQMVGPGRGAKRIEGVDPVKPMWYAFSCAIYTCILAMVVLACVATPMYQRQYFIDNPNNKISNWFLWTDMAFAVIFTLESLIKIIADGFFFTPNAYFRSSWGLIDGIVLVTLWISVATWLLDLRDVSRAVGAFKALRALRLLNISDDARDTFHSVIILGIWKIISAAFVSLSLLIPFAIYGLNLFNGQFLACNDMTSPITNLTDCTGEYMSSPFNWNVLAPRQVANPYFDFDNFGDSLSILFQIVSQEGWIDVMWSAMEARGVGINPAPYASQGNAVFFIIFNLLGSVFVLTLFVSVFMRNYTEQTGVAFLTAEQRSWLELRKLLRQISPSKRPSNRPEERWKNFCYRIAVKKHGRWQKIITAVLVMHLILLVIEFYPEVEWWEHIRDAIFIGFTIVYIVNIGIRIIGLTWRRFRKSSWDLYSILSITGTVITTILDFAHHREDPISKTLHKLFLVSIALLLIPRNNQLDQLFKTAAASFTAIANLLATWFVLFLVFAIAMNQTLGLTRFASLENDNINLRTVPKALILLFRMSCGEGWNNIMEDYASVQPPFCIVGNSFFDSDCGSGPWARALFILWNILSMYIFVSMFVSLIYESFSYVYQRSSGLSSISRDEIRRFKQAWATFDPDGTGYISKAQFPKLLGELSGVFEMRIYDGEHTVGRILEDCSVDLRNNPMNGQGVVAGIDLESLNHRLSTINVDEIRRRRARLNIFSQEVLVSADPDRGVSFLSCLMILAHYNVISDSKSLRLEEFLRRRYRLQRVEEEVRRRIVIGFFDTLYWSRQFRRRQELRHSARMVDIPQFAVPEIFIDDRDAPSPRAETFEDSDVSSSNISPRDVSHSKYASLGQSLSLSTPSTPDHPISPTTGTATRPRGSSIGSSPTRSEHLLTPRASPQFRPRSRTDASEIDPLTVFDGPASPSVLLSPTSPSGYGGGSSTALDTNAPPGSAVSTGPGTRHRRQQSSAGSGHLTAMEAFDNSAWGESIRKSFTLRRKNTKGRGRLGSRLDV